MRAAMERQPAIDEDMLHVFTADLLAAFKRPGIVAYHTPNGGKRHISVANKLKKMGTLPGVADWTFLMPGARTVFLELKDQEGRQWDSQVDFQRDVEALGCLIVPLIFFSRAPTRRGLGLGGSRRY
jgi:hypothetical protein